MDANKGQDGGRERAFTALVGRYQTGLRRVCYAILKDEEAANDAVQETFLKAYRTMDYSMGNGQIFSSFGKKRLGSLYFRRALL